MSHIDSQSNLIMQLILLPSPGEFFFFKINYFEIVLVNDFREKETIKALD